MSTLLSLDPGIRGAGVAYWINGVLVDCAYVKNPAKVGAGPAECVAMAIAIKNWFGIRSLNEFVCEWSRIYQRAQGKSKGDPNDLRSLWGVDCAFAALIPTAKLCFVEPAGWKGQMVHEAVQIRLAARLLPVEKAILKASCDWTGKTFSHNTEDSVGIGLHHLGRFERKRVIHRKSDTTQGGIP